MLFVIALVAAACGDSGDDTTTTAGEDTTQTTSTPTTSPPDDGDGDGDGPLAAKFPAGSLTIGIANEVPYGYEDATTGDATGEAPEVAKAILSELGVDDVDAVVVEFGALIPGLQAGQYDMIAAGMFITPERAEQIIFSDPDYCGATAFAVPEGNPLGLSDFGSIADGDAIVGVLSGAVEEGYALDSGVPDDRVSRFADTPSVFDALVAGRIDAVALTDVTVATQVAALDGFESTAGFIPVINGEEQLGCGGFGFIDQEFRDIFNAKLKEFQADGKILPIVEPFGFSATAVDKAATLTVADLTG